MIRFLIDAQLPPDLARRLAARGYPSEHVNRIELGVASDTDIWRRATRTASTLVTEDEDFIAFTARGTAGPQIVWIRLGNITNNALWRAIDPRLDEIVQALNAGEKVVEVL